MKFQTPFLLVQYKLQHLPTLQTKMVTTRCLWLCKATSQCKNIYQMVAAGNGWLHKDFADTKVAPRIEKKEYLAGQVFAFHSTHLLYCLDFMSQTLIFILRCWKSRFASYCTCFAWHMSLALAFELWLVFMLNLVYYLCGFPTYGILLRVWFLQHTSLAAIL